MLLHWSLKHHRKQIRTLSVRAVLAFRARPLTFGQAAARCLTFLEGPVPRGLSISSCREFEFVFLLAGDETESADPHRPRGRSDAKARPSGFASRSSLCSRCV